MCVSCVVGSSFSSGVLFVGKYPVHRFPYGTNFGVRTAAKRWTVDSKSSNSVKFPSESGILIHLDGIILMKLSFFCNSMLFSVGIIVVGVAGYLFVEDIIFLTNIFNVITI